jgi:dGTPase
VVAFSAPVARELKALKAFLMARVYRSRKVMDVMEEAEAAVAQLFARYLSDPAVLPEAWRAAQQGLPERKRARVTADFVAGMTDRYVFDQHKLLFPGAV